MPRPESDQDLLPSVLDRLIDREPRVSTEAATGRSRGLAQLKESIKRDLEWLLNSKRTALAPSDDLGHLATSLLTYGLPDLTAVTPDSDQGRSRLLRAVAEAIRRFEPRLSSVVVSPEEGRAFDRAIRFRIDAILQVEPEPEPVVYDSVLQLNTKAFVVQGG